MLIFAEGGILETPEKNPQSKARTNIWHWAWIEPRPHWWEASTLTTAPSLLLWGLGEFSKVMQILDYVSSLHNCLEFSKPTSCLDEAMCFLFLLHFLLLFSQSPPTLISKILAPLAKNVGSYYPQVFESRHVQTSFTFPGWFEKSGFHYLFVVLGRTIDKTAGKLNFYIPSNLY